MFVVLDLVSQISSRYLEGMEPPEHDEILFVDSSLDANGTLHVLFVIVNDEKTTYSDAKVYYQRFHANGTIQSPRELVFTYAWTHAGFYRMRLILTNDSALVLWGEILDRHDELYCMYRGLGQGNWSNRVNILTQEYANLSLDIDSFSVATNGEEVFLSFERMIDDHLDVWRTDVHFTKSSDSGATWSEPVRLSKENNTDSETPHISSHGQDVLILWHEDVTGDKDPEERGAVNKNYHHIYMKVSINSGETWSDEKFLFKTKNQRQVLGALDHTGDVHAFWQTYEGRDSKPMYSKYTVHGEELIAGKPLHNDYRTSWVYGIEHVNSPETDNRTEEISVYIETENNKLGTTDMWFCVVNGTGDIQNSMEWHFEKNVEYPTINHWQNDTFLIMWIQWETPSRGWFLHEVHIANFQIGQTDGADVVLNPIPELAPVDDLGKMQDILTNLYLVTGIIFIVIVMNYAKSGPLIPDGLKRHLGMETLSIIHVLKYLGPLIGIILFFNFRIQDFYPTIMVYIGIFLFEFTLITEEFISRFQVSRNVRNLHLFPLILLVLSVGSSIENSNDAIGWIAYSLCMVNMFIPLVYITVLSDSTPENVGLSGSVPGNLGMIRAPVDYQMNSKHMSYQKLLEEFTRFKNRKCYIIAILWFIQPFLLIILMNPGT